MWNQLESFKNHFLQLQLPTYKSEDINSIVQRDLKIAQSKRDQCKFPKEGAKCKYSTYFDDHAQLAYGWYALPKLMREMCSDVKIIQWRAINSLSEFLYNPLNAQRAINEMDIVRKTSNAFLRLKAGFFQSEHNMEERLLQILYICTIYLNGSRKIVRNKLLMNALYQIIYCKETYEELTSKLLRSLSEKSEIASYLVNNCCALENLYDIFNKDLCRPLYPRDLWLHLSHFLEIIPEKGVKIGFFKIMYFRVKHRLTDYSGYNMKCFALLLRCADAQKKFDKIDGVQLLYLILTTEHLKDYEYVVEALMQGLFSKNAIWRCRELCDLPDILVQLAINTKNMNLQLYCFQALRMMGEMPCIKGYIKAVWLDSLSELTCLNEPTECARDEVVAWLERNINDSSPRLE